VRFAAGKRVTQPSYGAGTIVSTDERHTVIEFDDHGRRTFVTSMVALEPSSTPAPERAAARRRAAGKSAGAKRSAS
jgi:Protein of unknown function (DUF3553)